MQVVTINKYQELAARTIDRSKSDLDIWTNATLGLLGEVGEILEILNDFNVTDINKIKLELGDLWWYTAEIATVNNLELLRISGVYDPLKYSSPIEGFIIESAKIADWHKKRLLDNRELDKDWLVERLEALVDFLYQIGDGFELDVKEVWTANIEKLKVRYPKGFEAEASLNRADEETLKSFRFDEKRL